MKLEEAAVIRHERREGGYFLLSLRSPDIAARARPGQFLHVRLPAPADVLLRRPFSIFQTARDEVRILYKPVGRGTHAMTALQPGDVLSIIGPLGNGFPTPGPEVHAVLVAGGYGMAALYLLAAAAPRAGTAFFGGAGAADILCVPEFEALGWRVFIATEDGRLGARGLVTAPLDAWLAERGRPAPLEFFACGPNGMLKAVAARAAAVGARAWVSMDRNLGCGVGACLTCVQRVRAPGGEIGWARVCKEGPVFEAGSIVWEEEE